MKKSVLWVLLLLAITLFGFTSCSDDDDSSGGSSVDRKYGVYVFNNGPMNSNSASISYYSIGGKKVTPNIFKSANGKNLGDVCQDMLFYGSKVYISVYSSNLIYVTDKDFKVISTIQNSEEEDGLDPRYFDAHNGKVYVTYYNGYLARIDTTSLTIDKRIKVGPYPEMVKVVNNKVYVANSGGMDPKGFNNTVSVVDTGMTSQKEIEVAMNPVELQADKNSNLYLVSRGDYSKTGPSLLQQINTTTDVVTALDTGRCYSIFPIDDRLYMLDKKWIEVQEQNVVISNILYYDINSKKVVEKSLITDDTNIADISFIAKEPVSGKYYLGAANGTNSGDVYIFSSEGKLESKFDTGGAYPMGAWFINEQ